MSRVPPLDRSRDAPGRALAVVAGALVLASGLGGCGAGVGTIEPIWPPSVAFSHWDSLSADSCRGWLANIGHPVRNGSVQLLYATALGETSQVILVGAIGDPNCQAPCFEFTPFLASPQLTSGEPRFPRVGLISWDGGSTSEAPRAPDLDFSNWCWTAPDSLQGQLINRGGWAYHVVMTLESRDGIRDFFPPSGRVPESRAWAFKSVARESSGVILPPKILEVRWEDYGGVFSRLESPPVDTTTSRCY